MTNRIRWAAVLFVTVMPVLTVHAQVYYSPVFNMPLQPAPSPSNGGFYWVQPDGRLWGPNYYLVPPFTPITGFNGTAVGQKVFADVFSQYVRKGSAQIAKTHGQGNDHKNLGVGQYNMDYSDPQSVNAFELPRMPGNPTLPPQQQPAWPARYPSYPSNLGYTPQAYGYGYGMPAAQRPVMAARPAPAEFYQAYYQPMYYGNQIVPMQGQVAPPAAVAPPAPNATPAPPNPRNYAGNGCPQPIYLPGMPQTGYNPNMPGMPYSFPNPGYAPDMPGLPNTGVYAPSVPNNMPGLPNTGVYQFPPPAYAPNVPHIPNQIPPLPSPNYSPRLPCPSYEPPQCQQGCEGGNPGYYHPAGIRSPRDFFMWGEVQEDERLREFRALQVP